MAHRIGSKRIRRSMKGLSETHAYAEGERARRLRRPIAVGPRGRRRLSRGGRDYYLKKRVERVAPLLIDVFMEGLGQKARERLIRKTVEKSRSASAAEDREMKSEAAIARVVDTGGEAQERTPEGRGIDGYELVFSNWVKESLSAPRGIIPDGSVAHELLHLFWTTGKLELKNPYLVVRAVSAYFLLLGLPCTAKSKRRADMVLKRNRERLKLPSEGEIVELRKEEARTGVNIATLLENEYFSVAQDLGLKAALLEAETMKPGIGLFFIREVCNGKRPKQAETALTKRPPPELKKWQERHGKQWQGRILRGALEEKIAADLRFRKLREARGKGKGEK